MKMKLDESVVSHINEINESLDMKTKLLDNDTVREILEESGPSVKPERMSTVVKMLQLQESAINENNTTPNIATWTKKLQPLLRRIAPAMFAHEIAGVQPVDGPTSEIFVIKSKYSGSKDAPIDLDAKILVFSGSTTVAVDDTITAAGGATGTVKYVEDGATAGVTKAIVEVASGTFVEGEEFDVGGSFTNDGDELTIDAIYSSESAYKQILKDYSGPYSTTAGEALADDTRTLSVTVDKVPVSVKTRALKANFTMELVQDLKAMHGADADKEIMSFLEHEILMDLDREIIDTYKSIANAEPDFAVATTSDSQGRWSLEMYAGLYQKIVKMSVEIGKDTQRGSGNTLVATGSVIAALDALGKFREMDYSNNVDVYSNQATVFRGTLQNGMKVYQDWFNDGQEYAMVLYKGPSAWDAGVIYSPYQPLTLVEAVDPATLQPVLGFKTRYGLTTNTAFDEDGGSSYARYCVIDFSSTPLK